MTTMTTAAGRRQVRGKSTTGAHARSQSPSHVRTSKYRAHHPRANCKVGHQSPPSPEMNQNQNPENKLRRSSARLASQNQQNKKRKCLSSSCNCDELVVSPAPKSKKKRKGEAQNDDGNGTEADKAEQAPKQKQQKQQQKVGKRISTTKHPKQQPQPTNNSSAQPVEVVEVQRSSSRRQQLKTKPNGRGGETRKTVVSHAVVPYKQKKEKKMPASKPEAQSQKRAVFLHFLVQLIEDRQVEEAIRMLELNWGDLFTGQHPMLHIRMLKLGFLDALNAANNIINNNDDGQEEDEQMEQDEEEENHQPQQKQQKLAADQQAALNMRKAVALGREAKRQLDSLVANSTRTGSLKHRQTIGELQRSLQHIWVDDLDEEQENGLVDDRKQIAAQLSQIIGQTQMLAFE